MLASCQVKVYRVVTSSVANRTPKRRARGAQELCGDKRGAVGRGLVTIRQGGGSATGGPNRTNRVSLGGGEHAAVS